MIDTKNLVSVIFLLLNCFSQVVLSDSLLNSAFLRDLENCFAIKNNVNCRKFVIQSEKMQLNEYAKGNLKCQTSILGLQTELIRSIYFKTNNKESFGKSIPYLIKNC